MNEYIFKIKKFFPPELIARPYWLGWKNINDTKVPINLKNGTPGKSNDPMTWVPFQLASLTFQKYGCAGLGFVLQHPFIGIDLDDCFDSDKGLNQFAKDTIKKFNSYTEYSPSTGIHIFAKGDLPKATKTKEIEIYQTGRFFTVTGRHVEGTPKTVRVLTTELDEYKQPEQQRNPTGWVSEALLNMEVGNIDTTLFRVLSKLRNDGYSDTDARILLQPYADKAGATPGHLDDKIAHVWKSYVPKQLKVIDNKTVTGDQLLKEAQTPQAENDGTLGITEFLAQDEKVEWLIPGIVSKKSLGFVGGLPETKKSWACMDLAIECAKGGGYWLGKFPVSDCKVLFIDQERFKGETMRRFKALIKAKHLNPKDLKLKVKSGTTVRIDLQHSFEAFEREIKKDKPDLIIVDSFVTFHVSEENNRKDIQDVLERVKVLRNEVGCAFMFIDHENKGVFHETTEGIPPTLGTLAGSIAKSASAEYVFTIRKHENDSSMVYMTKNTLAPCLEPFLVKLTDLKEDKSEISIKAY